MVPLVMHDAQHIPTFFLASSVDIFLESEAIGFSRAVGAELELDPTPRLIGVAVGGKLTIIDDDVSDPNAIEIALARVSVHVLMTPVIVVDESECRMFAQLLGVKLSCNARKDRAMDSNSLAVCKLVLEVTWFKVPVVGLLQRNAHGNEG